MPDSPPMPLTSAEAPLAAGFEVLLFDLDGVIYVGPHAVPGAADSVARALAVGLRCRYVTNNASRPPADVARHLRELGVPAGDDDVVSAAQEGAELLATKVPAGSQVLAVGGPGVSLALTELGLVPVSRFAEGVHGVLQGYGPDVGWRDLAEASYAVSAGAAWVATNPDLTVPTPRGTAPGNGQLVAVVARTTGRDPEVTGKPGPGLFLSAVRRAGNGPALVIGDRLDTDIAGAVAAGLPSLLVLTGVTDAGRLLAAAPHERPTYLSADLGGLWHAHPAVVRARDGWSCGEARARVAAGRLEIRAGGEQGGGGSDSPSGQGGTADGEDRLDVLRAACAAVWTAVDQGLPVDWGTAAQSLGPDSG